MKENFVGGFSGVSNEYPLHVIISSLKSKAPQKNLNTNYTISPVSTECAVNTLIQTYFRCQHINRPANAHHTKFHEAAGSLKQD